MSDPADMVRDAAGRPVACRKLVVMPPDRGRQWLEARGVSS